MQATSAGWFRGPRVACGTQVKVEIRSRYRVQRGRRGHRMFHVKRRMRGHAPARRAAVAPSPHARTALADPARGRPRAGGPPSRIDRPGVSAVACVGSTRPNVRPPPQRAAWSTSVRAESMRAIPSARRLPVTFADQLPSQAHRCCGPQGSAVPARNERRSRAAPNSPAMGGKPRVSRETFPGLRQQKLCGRAIRMFHVKHTRSDTARIVPPPRGGYRASGASMTHASTVAPRC